MTGVLRKAACRYCGQPVVWITTPGGEMKCLDPEYIAYKESKKGNDILYSDRGEAIRCNIIERREGVWPTGLARRAHNDHARSAEA